MQWICVVVALAGCARVTDGNNGGRDLGVAADLAGGGGGGGAGGAGSGDDLASGASDLAPAGVPDLAQPGVPDLAQPGVPDLAQPGVPDLASSSTGVTVHVLIDNFCNSSTNPLVINAPLHVPLALSFVNDSHDYNSDIWSSRGYGVLDRPRGATWKDPIQHCLNPNPCTESFDVGIQGGPVGGACPNYRLQIHCN